MPPKQILKVEDNDGNIYLAVPGQQIGDFVVSNRGELLPLAKSSESEFDDDPINEPLPTDDPVAVQPLVSSSGKPDEPNSAEGNGDRAGDELSSSKPVEDGLKSLTALTQIMDVSLDLIALETDLVLDATQMAIDQVQDKRIDWLEEGPEVSLMSIMMSTMLYSLAGLGVGVFAKLVVFRAFRASAKYSFAGFAQQAVQKKLDIAKSQAQSAAKQEFSTLIALNQQRIRLTEKVTYHEARWLSKANQLPDLSKFPVSQRRGANFRKVQANQLKNNPELRRQNDLIKQTLQEKARVEANISQATKNATKTMQDLQKRSSDIVSDASKQRRQLASSLKGFRQSIPSVSQTISDVATRAASTKNIFVQSGKEKQKTKPIAPPQGAEIVSAIGDSVSTILKSQAQLIHRKQREEIFNIRAETGKLLNLASTYPENALTDSIEVLRQSVEHLAISELSKEEYMVGVKLMALEIEFSIWALMGVVYLDEQRAQDMFGEPDVDTSIGRGLSARGSKRVMDYLIRRFKPYIFDKEPFQSDYFFRKAINDKGRLAAAMGVRREQLKSNGQELLKNSEDASVAGDDQPNIEEPVKVRYPATLKESLKENKEGEVDSSEPSHNDAPPEEPVPDPTDNP